MNSENRAAIRISLLILTLLVLGSGCNNRTEPSEKQQIEHLGTHKNQSQANKGAFFRIVNTSKNRYKRVILSGGSDEIDYGELRPKAMTKYKFAKDIERHISADIELEGERLVVHPAHPGYRWLVAGAQYTLYVNAHAKDPLRCEKDLHSPDENVPPKIRGVTLGDNTRDILEAFGDPIETREWEDGARILRTTVYKGVTFCQLDCRFGEDCGICEIGLTTDRYTLPPGIRVGQTKEDIFERLDCECKQEFAEKNVFICWVGPSYGYRIVIKNNIAVKISIIDELG